MNNNLEFFLRNNCDLINWKPTQQQLFSIKKEIDDAIRNGQRLSKSDCQHIVTKHCGPTEMMIFSSVDNSDLNTLLALAVQRDSDTQ